MAKIVVDTPTMEGLWFRKYADALVKIIVESRSPFTLGILGEWGVGKTSLMKTMCGKLKDDEHGKNVIPIWFNAWRCERERNLAIIPLLQLLVSEIKDKKLRKAFIEILKSLQLKFALPGGVEVSVGGRSQTKVKKDLYYTQLKKIKTALGDKKIVVFIDDLDRCAPDKILEVLESTKVFLDIKGFVYVLGLSPEVVVKAIEQKYEDMGISGEDYLEKIVQIPFRIPDWDVTDRGEFLTDLIDKGKIDPNYEGTIDKYKDIIQEAIERTPRQLKRFINTYICEQEVFKEKGLKPEIHLILTILKFKWYDFYQNLFDERFRKNLKEILHNQKDLREELKLKDGLFDFINSSKARKTIEEIIDMSDTQLSEYRRAGRVIPQKISEPVTFRGKFIELLKAGKVSTFNTLRYSKSLEEIDLGNADLSWANLSKANLKGADLSKADLSWADLSWANLKGTDLSEADLSEADLSWANLSKADLSWADLSKANLSEADLKGANLRGANLRSGIILIKEQYYQDAKVSNANFENALICDRGFLQYLKENGAKNVPDEVSTKEEFINEMKKRGLDIGDIEQFLKE